MILFHSSCVVRIFVTSQLLTIPISLQFDKLKKELELSVVDIRMSHRFDDVEEYLGTSVNSNSASTQEE